MKVLLSAFQCDINGISEAYLGAKWYDEMSKLCDVTVLTGDKYPTSSIKPSSIWEPKNNFLKKTNSAVKFDYFFFNLLANFKIKNQIKDYDVLHHISPVAPRYPVSVSKFSSKFILGPIAGGLRVPPSFAKEVEGSEEFFFKLRRFDDWRFKFDKPLINTYERADKIIIAGDYVKLRLPGRFHSKCIQMLDVGIDTHLYDYSPRKIDTLDLQLIYVGRVVPYKGLIYLLKAIVNLPSHIKKFIKLDIAGNKDNNNYEKVCRKFVLDNKIDNIVKFHGFIAKSKVQELYEKAHVFCFPSLAEAGGTVVLEAMAKGLPVLAVDYGGPSQSVDKSSGILVSPDSVEQLIEDFSSHITYFYNNRLVIKELGEGARKRAELYFDWKVRSKKMMEIYSSV